MGFLRQPILLWLCAYPPSGLTEKGLNLGEGVVTAFLVFGATVQYGLQGRMPTACYAS